MKYLLPVGPEALVRTFGDLGPPHGSGATTQCQASVAPCQGGFMGLQWWGDAPCPFLDPKSFPWSSHGLSEGSGKVTVGDTGGGHQLLKYFIPAKLC